MLLSYFDELHPSYVPAKRREMSRTDVMWTHWQLLMAFNDSWKQNFPGLRYPCDQRIRGFLTRCAI